MNHCYFFFFILFWIKILLFFYFCLIFNKFLMITSAFLTKIGSTWLTMMEPFRYIYFFLALVTEYKITFRIGHFLHPLHRMFSITISYWSFLILNLIILVIFWLTTITITMIITWRTVRMIISGIIFTTVLIFIINVKYFFFIIAIN